MVALVGQTRMRAVARVVPSMTVTVGGSAATAGTGNRTGSEMAKFRNLLQQGCALPFQSGQGIGHEALLAERNTYARLMGHKIEPADWPFLCRNGCSRMARTHSGSLQLGSGLPTR